MPIITDEWPGLEELFAPDREVLVARTTADALHHLDSLDEQAAEELARRVMRLGPWFHNLHLPDGTQTAPQHLLGDFPTVKWRQIAPWMPEDLIGCRALDIEPRYLEQARWAARQFGLESQLTFRQAPVYELAGSRERYDLVCFLGVLYHLRHPLLRSM